MTKLRIYTGIVLAVAGASCAVDAWAADIVPVKAPPATAASAPKPCTDGWTFIATDCQLTWHASRSTARLTRGSAGRATARRGTHDPLVGASYLIQKQNNSALWALHPTR